MQISEGEVIINQINKPLEIQMKVRSVPQSLREGWKASASYNQSYMRFNTSLQGMSHGAVH